MNEDIMLLSNRLIYENRLQCGSQEVAKQALALPARKTCMAMHIGSTCREDCWIQALLEEK